MYSWSIFLISVGSIIIMMSTSTDKSWGQLILGLLIIVGGILMFIRKRKKG